MLLNNVKLLHGTDPVNITVKEKYITGIRTAAGNSTEYFQLRFEHAIAFPGLINSHDHLDFNCFPALGDQHYNNYTEWGKHIHETYRQEIDAVLQIPGNLRAIWGMYKNLLAGVTTVVNHGSFLLIEKPLIDILQNTQNLHSVKFEKAWKWKLNNPLLKKKDCVIHTGEGTDRQSAEEIDALIQWNLLKRNLIGIHGVAMNAEQAKKFRALVWCPESNRFLLNRDAGIKNLKDHTKLLLGTDSTLTGNWNIWHHLRLARKTGLVSDEELFDMLTKTAAEIWSSGNGQLLENKYADIVIAKANNTGWADFFKTDPEDILLVIKKGVIRLFDSGLLSQLQQLNFNTGSFSQVSMNNSKKFVEGDLTALSNTIKEYYPNAIFPFHTHQATKMTVDA